MCGIVGWIDLEKNLTSNVHILEKMSEKLSPRGPDASASLLRPPGAPDPG